MIDETMLYRMVRYFGILTYEHYNLQRQFNERFNLPFSETFTVEKIMKNICKDFGLKYEVFLEHSDLEKWNNEL